ncbi:aspartate/glutamate racemase family protein [Paenibacillus cremeus]|uniref:Asp/Glu/hydantoin racemase n=1 Tax=Paenibacillus cremeus TaxID=2163881 RepID=A0A559K8D0_9BACL|nr:aspartate/glutamate racemase family protein [Paenibacillus cremeus]TVY08396.1 hypothetical protein FPZ49_19350 [Paenibacillus cremeus]
MSRKLGVIHTTPVTVDVFKALAAELMPGCSVINFVDDSILPELALPGTKVESVQDKLVQYAKYAERAGADVILSACSSVGEAASAMCSSVSVPVIRIDDAMATEAIRQGTKIGVAATLETTLRPTIELLQQKARDTGCSRYYLAKLISS